MPRSLFLLLLLCPLLSAADEPVPVKQAASKMTVPEGFRVSQFAGEPDVVQPIAFTFDDRGRMWVVECLSYPNWRHDRTGRDRVTILEDTDGDGTHDQRTVFLDNGCNLSGIEVGYGGVWLCSVPNLIFIPDRNGDDKPDGEPQIILDGWNIKDTKHNVFNSLNWGPDGWLYGCNGIQSKSIVGKPGTPEKDRVAFDCGVWRYHPTRTTFEVVAWGTTNPWGLDWDDHGEMYITNCVIEHLFHFQIGGHYIRMYGEDPNRNTYALMGPACDHKHWGGGDWTSSRSDQKTGELKKEHDDAGGGHAHSGCAIYLGDNFPPEYRDSLFTSNIHGSRLNRDTLHRTPTGVVGSHAKDFLFANDPWFRGICVKLGPDGGIYVSDWCDTGECHNYKVVDAANGRIYRVVFGDQRGRYGDIAKMTDEELFQAQLSKNEWLVRRCRLELAERAANSTLSRDPVTSVRSIWKQAKTSAQSLRVLWAAHCVGELDADGLNEAMASSHEALRVWGARLAADRWATTSRLPKSFDTLVAEEKSPFVLAALAGALQRLPAKQCREFTRKLVSRVGEDSATDLTLMLWYAMEHGWSDASGNDWHWAITEPKSALLRRFATRYLVSTVADRQQRLDEIFDVMRKDGLTGREAEAVLAGVQEAFAGVRSFSEPSAWSKLYSEFEKSSSGEVRRRAESLAVLFRNPQALTTLKARITDQTATPEARNAAIALLAQHQVSGLGPILKAALTDATIRGSALRALAAYPNEQTPSAILKVYPQLSPSEKADAIQTLVSRPAYAQELLNAMEKGIVPKADVTVFTARQIQSLNDKNVTSQLQKVWGTIRPASQTRIEQAKRIKELLTAERMKSAKPAQGRAIFTKHCATCHKMFGEGGAVGPELTGSQRSNLDYLLENILDPSAVVPREFRLTTFNMIDGRLVSGIILRETSDGVTVRTLNEELILPKADIESQRATALSIMPDGLLDQLKPEELRDLVGYLASPTQVKQ